MHYIWYDKLYFKEDNAKKKTRLLHRLEKGKPEPNVYILALPESRERNILDIYSSLELMQPHYKNRSKYVVGIARGKQDAIELASSIVGDMYNTNGEWQTCGEWANSTYKINNTNGNFDIRAFLNFYEDTFSGKEVL